MDGFTIDPKLDLVLEREVNVPPRLLWKAWTEPEHLMPWFCPKPWQTVECEIDLRPGGKFRTVMQGPEGQRMDNTGCYLEVVPERRLVWTEVMLPGYRPHPNPMLFFTAAVLIEPSGKGARYRALAIHRDPQGRENHEKMGFHEGWGTALDQLVEYAKTL